MSVRSGWLRRVGYKLLAYTDTDRVDVDGETLTQVLESISNDIENLQVDNVANKQKIEQNRQSAEQAIDIATQMNNALVFDTEVEMVSFLSDVLNKGKYPVGTNIYVIAEHADDHWISAALDEPNDQGMYYTLQVMETATIKLDQYEQAKNYLYRCLCNSEFSSDKVYRKDSIIRKDYIVYRCREDLEEPGEWDPSKWVEADIASMLEIALQGYEFQVVQGEVISSVDVIDMSADIKRRLTELETQLVNKTTVVTQVSSEETRIEETDESNNRSVVTIITNSGDTTTVNKTVTTGEDDIYNYNYNSVTTKVSEGVTRTVESYSKVLKG